MKAVLLVGLLACSSREAASTERGPAYTASIANQLRGLADQCETKPGSGGVAEVRTCIGPKGPLRIELSADRHIRMLEFTVVVASAWEARAVVERTFPGIVSPAVIEAAKAQLQPTAASTAPATVDGVTVGVTIVGQRYTVSLAW